MKVGDFVRFNSTIIRANGHLALLSDRGVVVGMSANKRIASVVWSDGQTGDYRVKNLARTVGVMGHAARSVGEKRRPMRDKGNRRPMPTQGNQTPAPLPSSTVGAWVVVDERTVKGRKLDPPIMGNKGELITFMPFKVPLRVSEVRGTHWPAGTANIVISRSAQAVTVTFPNGEKVSHTHTGGRAWVMGRFGAETGESLCEKLRI